MNHSSSQLLPLYLQKLIFTIHSHHILIILWHSSTLVQISVWSFNSTEQTLSPLGVFASDDRWVSWSFKNSKHWPAARLSLSNIWYTASAVCTVTTESTLGCFEVSMATNPVQDGVHELFFTGISTVSVTRQPIRYKSVRTKDVGFYFTFHSNIHSSHHMRHLSDLYTAASDSTNGNKSRRW